MKGGLYYELRKNNILKYSVTKTAFSTLVTCDDKKLPVATTVAPAPGHYDIEKIQTCKIEKPTFGRCPRFKKIVSGLLIMILSLHHSETEVV